MDSLHPRIAQGWVGRLLARDPDLLPDAVDKRPISQAFLHEACEKYGVPWPLRSVNPNPSDCPIALKKAHPDNPFFDATRAMVEVESAGEGIPMTHCGHELTFHDNGVEIRGRSVAHVPYRPFLMMLRDTPPDAEEHPIERFLTLDRAMRGPRIRDLSSIAEIDLGPQAMSYHLGYGLLIPDREGRILNRRLRLTISTLEVFLQLWHSHLDFRRDILVDEVHHQPTS